MEELIVAEVLSLKELLPSSGHCRVGHCRGKVGHCRGKAQCFCQNNYLFAEIRGANY